MHLVLGVAPAYRQAGKGMPYKRAPQIAGTMFMRFLKPG